MNILFVCSQNRLRSPTAEAVFSHHPGIEAVSAGTNADSPTPVSGDLIDWADIILVMEAVHRNKIVKKFGGQLRGKRLHVLGVPDRYEYMDSGLVKLLRGRVAKYTPQ